MAPLVGGSHILPMRRREFVVIPIGALAGALGGALSGMLAKKAIRLQPKLGRARVPLRFFTAAEARVVTAACERVFPADANGPGATDAGVVVYIDRQLAGPYGRDKYRYTKTPFGASSAEHGYQGAQNPGQVYRDGIRDLGDFANLSNDAQIAKLTNIANTPFFTLLRSHTLEGMFCDPAHGGNSNLAGWQLVGFPGPQMNYRADVDAHFGTPFRPKPASLEQVTGHKPVVWEDERG